MITQHLQQAIALWGGYPARPDNASCIRNSLFVGIQHCRVPNQ
ncbi:hypothetical protein [Nostoc sphaeroides]|uniref:Uncharacterized protein n=1 Tax=Nostoc sphaeroides CCNUC1 TaxID=2653204 RepID=A0A5P8VYC2_9NOSO|nr:hypothetical protein [Nostoc sphaeroides]QFS44819.1 hypothetical protein GXM_02294 [Nostoc sphaeroides CCNUC1]